ncbi:MAG: hypothetical protein V1494_07220 [Candidatus Diapherotrites archaeon]
MDLEQGPALEPHFGLNLELQGKALFKRITDFLLEEQREFIETGDPFKLKPIPVEKLVHEFGMKVNAIHKLFRVHGYNRIVTVNRNGKEVKVGVPAGLLFGKPPSGLIDALVLRSMKEFKGREKPVTSEEIAKLIREKTGREIARRTISASIGRMQITEGIRRQQTGAPKPEKQSKSSRPIRRRRTH